MFIAQRLLCVCTCAQLPRLALILGWTAATSATGHGAVRAVYLGVHGLASLGLITPPLLPDHFRALFTPSSWFHLCPLPGNRTGGFPEMVWVIIWWQYGYSGTHGDPRGGR